MGAVLNRSVAKDGVIAYQDHKDANLFHYIPGRIEAVLGETLANFQVKYFGINAKPFHVDFGNGMMESCVGGEMAGKAVPDIIDRQRAAVTQEIAKLFKVEAPRLVPLEISNVVIQPIFSKTIAQMGQRANADFPQLVKFGTSFNYNIMSGNSLFPEMVGSVISGATATENPEVGINITGLAEFYGDPWEVQIECDLSQVWKYTRTQVEVGINLGWLNLGTKIDKIAQDLIRNNVIKLTFIKGSGDDAFGRQLLETARSVYEKINAQVISGEGFFRFEPNPDPQPMGPEEKGWGAKLLPWTVSVNVGYGENVFNQSIKFSETLSYTGTLEVAVATSMNLATPCGAGTEQFFYDIQDKAVGCITKAKSDSLQKRLSAEASAKNQELLELYADVRAGKITAQQYTELKAILNTITFTEDADLSVEQATARFRNMRTALGKVKARGAKA